MDAYLMGKVSELETRIQNLEKEIDFLKKWPKKCDCFCHALEGRKFMKRAGNSVNNNINVAVICCDCPEVTL